MISFRLRIGTLLIAAVQMPAIAFAQTSPKKTADEMKAAYETHKGDFDYLLGDWEFTTISKTYGKGRGYWSAVRLATGQILDEFRIVGDNDETYYLTTTLRTYNAARNRWELVGMNEGGGLQDIGTGRRTGSEDTSNRASVLRRAILSTPVENSPNLRSKIPQPGRGGG